jgi:hypothetical protein
VGCHISIAQLTVLYIIERVTWIIRKGNHSNASTFSLKFYM